MYTRTGGDAAQSGLIAAECVQAIGAPGASIAKEVGHGGHA